MLKCVVFKTRDSGERAISDNIAIAENIAHNNTGYPFESQCGGGQCTFADAEDALVGISQGKNFLAVFINAVVNL